MKTLAEYLDLAAVAHGHLCAGQVLGVRLAMLGLQELGIDDPVADRKRIVTYVEIGDGIVDRSEEHTSELQSLTNIVCRLLLEKKKNMHIRLQSLRVLSRINQPLSLSSL